MAVRDGRRRRQKQGRAEGGRGTLRPRPARGSGRRRALRCGRDQARKSWRRRPGSAGSGERPAVSLWPPLSTLIEQHRDARPLLFRSAGPGAVDVEAEFHLVPRDVHVALLPVERLGPRVRPILLLQQVLAGTARQPRLGAQYPVASARLGPPREGIGHWHTPSVYRLPEGWGHRQRGAARVRDGLGDREGGQRRGTADMPARTSRAGRGAPWAGEGQPSRQGQGASLRTLPVRRRAQQGGSGWSPGKKEGVTLPRTPADGPPVVPRTHIQRAGVERRGDRTALGQTKEERRHRTPPHRLSRLGGRTPGRGCRPRLPAIDRGIACGEAPITGADLQVLRALRPFSA